MKRLLFVLPFLLCLMGCAQEVPETVPAPTYGLYDQEHPMQVQTNGAVKVYPLGEYDYRALAVMGEDTLLFGEDRLTLLSGENLVPVTTVAAPGLPLPGSGQIQINQSGLCYYSDKENAVIFLGTTLLEVGRLYLPEDITGTACISPEWNKLYYCASDHVRVLDLKTGTSKTLKTLNSNENRITGILMNGNYLRCVSRAANGTESCSIISTQTGKTLYEGEAYLQIISAGQKYCLPRLVHQLQEYIFGEGDNAPQSLFFEAGEEIVPIMENNALIRIHRTEENVKLEYFDLSAGKRKGEITLPGIQITQGFSGDGQGVWFCWEEKLYRWDPELSPTKDEMKYTKPYYTRENPDEEGLRAIEERLQKLEQTWGVEFIYRENALEVIPWEGYRFDTEYIPLILERRLTVLEQAMSHFPREFFAKATQWTGNPLQIVLVRGIYGDPAQGTRVSAPSIYYQLNGKAYLALSIWDELDRAFYHGVSHLIETRILSTCTAYYEWNTLNPPGFRYDNDYIANQNRKDDQYLQDADRFFIDMYSMSFAIEDRARILEYACLPENAGYFTSATMQEKLRRVCAGIREAFDLSGEDYLWEQYLNS